MHIMNTASPADQIEEYITLKGNMRRVLRSEIGMLRDALGAARHGKYYVTIDHLERAIDALSNALTEIPRS